MITVQKMRMTLKARETVMTTTAIQACIKRTWEKTERNQGRKTSFFPIFSQLEKKIFPIGKKKIRHSMSLGKNEKEKLAW